MALAVKKVNSKSAKAYKSLLEQPGRWDGIAESGGSGRSRRPRAPGVRSRVCRVEALRGAGPAAPPRPRGPLSQAGLGAAPHPGLATARAHEDSRHTRRRLQPWLAAPVSGSRQSGAAQARLSHGNRVHGLRGRRVVGACGAGDEHRASALRIRGRRRAGAVARDRGPCGVEGTVRPGAGSRSGPTFPSRGAPGAESSQEGPSPGFLFFCRDRGRLSVPSPVPHRREAEG